MTSKLVFMSKIGDFFKDYWENVKTALPEAGVNTLVGISIVFLALLFISFVISLFKYITVWDNRRKAKKAAKENEQKLPEQAIENTLSQIEKAEELSDDSELVAVITAAIYAYESEQGNSVNNGLVVRSIRKANKNAWQNA